MYKMHDIKYILCYIMLTNHIFFYIRVIGNIAIGLRNVRYHKKKMLLFIHDSFKPAACYLLIILY